MKRSTLDEKTRRKLRRSFKKDPIKVREEPLFRQRIKPSAEDYKRLRKQDLKEDYIDDSC